MKIVRRLMGELKRTLNSLNQHIRLKHPELSKMKRTVSTDMLVASLEDENLSDKNNEDSN